MAGSAGDIFYLFSSNIRPLYVQDILDVLAAPPGLKYRFRYEEQYVHKDARVREVDGKEALILFAIQQEAEYHEPAFVPVRRAEMISAGSEAGIYVFEFVLRGFVALEGTATHNPKRDDLREAVRRFDQALVTAGVPKPYGPSASYGKSVLDDANVFTEAADAATSFRATARTLQRTEWFHDARFVRVLSLKDEKGHDVQLRKQPNAYALEAGRTYQLELNHYQPAGFSGRSEFIVSADEDVLQVIGRAGFDISSRYDIVRLPIHASLPPRDEARETIVAIQPSTNVQGPTIRLPCQVSPPVKRTYAIAGAMVIALFAFGLPAAVTTLPQWSKFLLVGAGALIASYLQNFGFALPVPPGFGVSGRPDKHSAHHH